MNSYQLYDYKQKSLFDCQDSDSTISKEKVQNCSILEIDIEEIMQSEHQSDLLHPNITFKQFQQLNFKTVTSPYRDPLQKRTITVGKEYLNLKNWEEKRRKEQIISPVEKSNKAQRKRLLEQMIEKLNKNQKTMKDDQMDDSIIEKIQNIVGLLGEVEKQLKIKQKCSLGMKLKLKVDPNQRYFKRKDNLKDQFYYTSRQKINLNKQLPTTKSKEGLSKTKKQHNFVEKSSQHKQRGNFAARQYTTQNLYSTSLSQKKAKNRLICNESFEKERNSVEHTTSLIKQKREQIVQKQMKRRQKWYNRLIHKQ